VVEHDFVQARWSEIEALVRQEFQDSNFNDHKFDWVHLPHRRRKVRPPIYFCGDGGKDWDSNKVNFCF